MKRRIIIRFISAILVIATCLATFVSTIAAYDGEEILYVANQASGKIFFNSENCAVESKAQFDTSINNLSITRNNGRYTVAFELNDEEYCIDAEMVSAKMNNANGDHYLFAPEKSTYGTYEVVNIAFTTNANMFDVFPANSDLIGKSVIRIIFKDTLTHDEYCWETELFQKTRNYPTMMLSVSEDAISRANEYYYMSSTVSEENMVTEDFANSDKFYLSENEVNSIAQISHNPYYDLGIPDSTFKSATDSWKWLAVGKSSTGTYLPIRYYAYSYTKTGSANIMTHIMIVHHEAVIEDPIRFNGNGKYYYKAYCDLKIDLYRVPHTVVYYPNQDVYEFMLGGENQTQIVEPGIRWKKTSTGVPHVLYERATYSNADNNNFLGLGALVIKDIFVAWLNEKNYVLGTVTGDILDYISASNVNKNNGKGDTVATKEKYLDQYYFNFDDQIHAYGIAMGSVKSTIKGNLRNKDQYFGMRCSFAVPEANESSATDLSWTYYVTAGMR